MHNSSAASNPARSSTISTGPKGAVTRKVALVRHGETDWNLAGRLQGRTDIPLNQTGRDQATKTASQLVRQPWDIVVSSPLQRAFETAEIIGQAVGFGQPLIHEGLTEQCFGDAEGFTAVDAVLQGLDEGFPGQESHDEVTSRVWESWKEILEANPEPRIIVVCHGVVIRRLGEKLLETDLGILANGGFHIVRESGGVWA